MEPEELRKILSRPEGIKLDFKREFKLNKEPPSGTNKQEWSRFINGQWDELIKDIVALANGNVGTVKQPAFLIVGAGDELLPDGTRELFDTAELTIDQNQLLQTVNKAISPKIHDIHCEKINVDDKSLTVITIPPTPFLHETTRELITTKGYFNKDGYLEKSEIDHVYIEHTVFVRRNESVRPASQEERKKISQEKESGVPDNPPKDAPFHKKFTWMIGHLYKNLSKNKAFRTVFLVLGTIIPLVWFYVYSFWPEVQPLPPMSGEFNVAVTEFIVLNENGDVIRSEDGLSLATLLYERLNNSFGELNIQNINYEIRGPADLKPVKGKTKKEREDYVKKLAQDINANVVIYGVITKGDDSFFEPEFFVNYVGFEQASEILGQHELGRPIFVDLPIDKHIIVEIENPALSARTNALSLITIGLAYSSIDKVEEALKYLQQAEQTPGWLDNAGKEVAYLLIGNAYAEITSMEKSPTHLFDAYEAYEKALQINPVFTRAKLGLAGILYLQAIGDPNDPEGPIDYEKLKSAETMFIEALSDESAPESANIGDKVHFYLGQIYMLKRKNAGNDWYEKAKTEFLIVIDAYEHGKMNIVEFASLSYARLGLIARIQKNIDESIRRYLQAIDISSPYNKAYFYSKLGDVYYEANRINEAIEAYEHAISVAEFYGDAESVEKYSERLEEIQSSQKDVFMIIISTQ